MNEAMRRFLAGASSVVSDDETRRLRRIVQSKNCPAMVIDYDTPTWICAKTLDGQVIINTTIDFKCSVQDLIDRRPCAGRAKQIRFAAYRHYNQSQRHGKTIEEVVAILIKWEFDASCVVIEWSTSGCIWKLLNQMFESVGQGVLTLAERNHFLLIPLWRNVLPGIVTLSISFFFELISQSEGKFLIAAHNADSDMEMTLIALKVLTTHLSQ